MTHGCHNRPTFREWHMAQDGYTLSRQDADTRRPRMVKVMHTMTRDCQYTKQNPTDAGCTGCNHQRNQ